MGSYADLAARTAPGREGRPVTPGALWSHRYLLALDGADAETQRRERELINEVMRVVELVSPDGLDLIDKNDGSGRRVWARHPHRGDLQWCRRRERELLDEIGELLGIGPWPASAGLIVDWKAHRLKPD